VIVPKIIVTSGKCLRLDIIVRFRLDEVRPSSAGKSSPCVMADGILLSWLIVAFLHLVRPLQFKFLRRFAIVDSHASSDGYLGLIPVCWGSVDVSLRL